MNQCTQEEENLITKQATSSVQLLTTSQFTSFHVIPHKLWRWETSLANLNLHGLVNLSASFWSHERMDG